MATQMRRASSRRTSTGRPRTTIGAAGAGRLARGAGGQPRPSTTRAAPGVSVGSQTSRSARAGGGAQRVGSTSPPLTCLLYTSPSPRDRSLS
eukprot:8319930-Pyramimonas_sp.AAC.1